MYAPEVYVISYDEPIKIGKSAGGNNPWFRVRTESGSNRMDARKYNRVC